ncbi:class I SAM-dependent methyltransferase [Haliea sp. E17]|uniref:class I SAM-dependent methyltransferase n=1 Tax=Haliea sp. E17 TaxID=3401576 RepID=UPI003AAE6EED
MSQLDPRNWDNFWKRANVTSMEGADFRGNYDLEILDFWKNQFSKGADHVVDLATGNGALVWIVNDLLNSPEPRSRITGVDLASTSPFETLKRRPADYPLVKFVQNTSIEALPFKDDSIDFIISQWGLEYSTLCNTIPEASRVLKPKARMAFICHYEGSSILKDTTMKLEKFTVLLEKEVVFERYLELDALYNSHTSQKGVQSDPRHSRIVGSLNQALYSIQHYIGRSTDPSINVLPKILNNLSELFAPRQPLKQPRRAKDILKLKDNVLASVARIEDLRAAALSYDECDELEALITEAGFAMVERKPIVHSRLGNVGMAFAAARGGADLNGSKIRGHSAGR